MRNARPSRLPVLVYGLPFQGQRAASLGGVAHTAGVNPKATVLKCRHAATHLHTLLCHLLASRDPLIADPSHSVCPGHSLISCQEEPASKMLLIIKNQDTSCAFLCLHTEQPQGYQKLQGAETLGRPGGQLEVELLLREKGELLPVHAAGSGGLPGPKLS